MAELSKQDRPCDVLRNIANGKRVVTPLERALQNVEESRRLHALTKKLIEQSRPLIGKKSAWSDTANYLRAMAIYKIAIAHGSKERLIPENPKPTLHLLVRRARGRAVFPGRLRAQSSGRLYFAL